MSQDNNTNYDDLAQNLYPDQRGIPPTMAQNFLQQQHSVVSANDYMAMEISGNSPRGGSTMPPDSPTVFEQSLYPLSAAATKLEPKVINRINIEQLRERNIMPPDNKPQANYEAVRKLEMHQTKDSLTSKLKSRPDKKQLLDKGIMHDPETKKQVKNSLEEKLHHRPGALDVLKLGYFEPSTKPKKFQNVHVSSEKTGKTLQIHDYNFDKDNKMVKITEDMSKYGFDDHHGGNADPSENQKPGKRQKITKNALQKKHNELSEQYKVFLDLYEPKIMGQSVINSETDQTIETQKYLGLLTEEQRRSFQNSLQNSRKQPTIPSPPGPPPRNRFKQDGSLLNGGHNYNYYNCDWLKHESDFDKSVLMSKSYKQLQQQCLHRKLTGKGSKEELVNRLIFWKVSEDKAIQTQKENEQLKKTLAELQRKYDELQKERERGSQLPVVPERTTAESTDDTVSLNTSIGQPNTNANNNNNINQSISPFPNQITHGTVLPPIDASTTSHNLSGSINFANMSEINMIQNSGNLSYFPYKFTSEPDLNHAPNMGFHPNSVNHQHNFNNMMQYRTIITSPQDQITSSNSSLPIKNLHLSQNNNSNHDSSMPNIQTLNPLNQNNSVHSTPKNSPHNSSNYLHNNNNSSNNNQHLHQQQINDSGMVTGTTGSNRSGPILANPQNVYANLNINRITQNSDSNLSNNSNLTNNSRNLNPNNQMAINTTSNIPFSPTHQMTDNDENSMSLHELDQNLYILDPANVPSNIVAQNTKLFEHKIIQNRHKQSSIIPRYTKDSKPHRRPKGAKNSQGRRPNINKNNLHRACSGSTSSLNNHQNSPYSRPMMGDQQGSGQNQQQMTSFQQAAHSEHSYAMVYSPPSLSNDALQNQSMTKSQRSGLQHPSPYPMQHSRQPSNYSNSAYNSARESDFNDVASHSDSHHGQFLNNTMERSYEQLNYPDRCSISSKPSDISHSTGNPRKRGYKQSSKNSRKMVGRNQTLK